MEPTTDKNRATSDPRSQCQPHSASKPLGESADTKEQCNKKPRNLGRAARRRKAKSRSIDLALRALLNGEEDQEHQHEQQLPSDRSQSLPGVVQRRQENQVAFDKDEPILVSQLGYMPGNAVGVVGRVMDLETLYPCLHKLLVKVDSKRYSKNNIIVEKDGGNETMTGSSPTALKLYPLALRKMFKGGKSGRKFKSRKRGRDQINQSQSDQHDTNADVKEQDTTHSSIVNAGGLGPEETFGDAGAKEKNGDNTNNIIEPFPTMYWLTHPLLRTLISQLELGSTHNVIQVQETLASSPQHLSKLKEAHESYGRHRWELLTEEDREDVGKRKWTDAVGSVRGVAGIRKYDTVKCLHTHSAHYLAFLGQNSSGQDSDACEMIEENLVGKWTLKAVEKAVQESLKDVVDEK